MTANVGVNIRELELERLKELLEYYPDTGVFRWKIAHGFGLPGDVAGHITGGVGNGRMTNYIRIRIDTIRYPAHHLAWLYMTGEPPASEVDHWDNDGTNNAWVNLRPASRGQNEFNKGLRADNTSGVKGVRLTRVGTWEAKIKRDGKREHLGTFKTIEEATSAYAEASARLHGEFGRVAIRGDTQPAESGATYSIDIQVGAMPPVPYREGAKPESGATERWPHAEKPTKGKDKSEFWWASVAGANCEPVEVVKKDGERLAYTCGCGDPFYLDRPDCPLELIPDGEGAMDRPMTPKQEKNYWARQRRQSAIAATHSWRGPR